jgi:hypothetical protein
MSRPRFFAGLGALALVASLGTPTAAAAAPAAAPVVIASGFTGPLNISATNSYLYVADAFAGQLVRISLRTHAKKVLASAGVGGVGAFGTRVDVTVTREPESGLPQGAAGLARLVNGKLVNVADLLAYEARNNPDRQRHQVGKDADSWSNPYGVLALTGRTFVADAGANDLLEVTTAGAIRTVTAFPNITTGKCAGAVNNDPQHSGCDPVPTGVAMGPDGQLYVSGLGAEVAGRIWRVDPQSGRIGYVFGGLPPLTGIAVSSDGTIYASSLFTDSIFRIAPDRTRSVAVVPKATGLSWRNGVLYAASQTGRIFSVPAGAFK